MKSKVEKQEALSQLQSRFADCEAVVICKFEGLTVAEDQALRDALRGRGASYQVVSNRLAHRAARDTPFEGALADQRGMTALAFPGEDLVGALKALVEYAKENESFSFTAGVVEGRALDMDQLAGLSKLPGKAGIHAQLLHLLNSSSRRLLGVLSAPGRDVAAIVQQAVKEQKFEE